MSELLAIDGLKTYFYTEEGIVRAVDGVQLQIRKGEILGLVGESGCGKSVMALSIMRLVPRPGRIVEGWIGFEGENILEKSEDEMRCLRGSKISMVFQDPIASLDPVYSVGEQIGEAFRFGRSMSGKKEIRMNVERILNLVKIPDPKRVMRSHPHELSGGMAQRVMIAIALAPEPALLIADEPTTSLDVTIQEQILKLLRDLNKDLGLSVFLITHNFGIVAMICDRVAAMYAGTVIETGKVIDILDNPKHPYTVGLIKAFPRLRSKEKRFETIGGEVPDLLAPPPGCRFRPRCPFSMEVCGKSRPPLREVAPDHEVACYLDEVQ